MHKLLLAGLIIISSFLFSCREDLVEFADIQKDSGSIYLNSFPQGAEIFLKNTKTSFKTPEEFQELDPGEYVFTLKLNGYNDTTIVAKVESGKNNFLSVYLRRKI